MKTGRQKALRMGLLSVSPLALLAVLLAFASVSPRQAPPPQKKAAAFPLSLFEQATNDDYVNEASCVRCHANSHATFQLSPHNPYVSDPNASKDRHGCQSCHGPGRPHIQHTKPEDDRYKYVISYKRATPMQASQACLRCHNDSITIAHWQRNNHARANVACTACHKIHQDPTDAETPAASPANVKGARPPVFIAAAPPRKMLKAPEATLCGQCHQREVGEFRQNFHHPVPEGRLVCSNCHNIHPRRDNEKQTAAQTRLRPAKELCVTCHAETAGPFVYEHDPVAGLTGEGCMECHRPHGSNNPKMLSTFSRGVCNQCHTDKANNHHPGRSCWDSGCHVAVHGSNTDPHLLRR